MRVLWNVGPATVRTFGAYYAVARSLGYLQREISEFFEYLSLSHYEIDPPFDATLQFLLI
jgi:hypothetical protein